MFLIFLFKQFKLLPRQFILPQDQLQLLHSDLPLCVRLIFFLL